MAKVNIPTIPFIIMSLFLLEGVCHAKNTEKLADSGWEVIESRYCNIFCHPDVDIKRVNKMPLNLWAWYEVAKEIEATSEEQLISAAKSMGIRVFQEVENAIVNGFQEYWWSKQ